MNYWMTTHWPPDESEDLETFVPGGVWLPNGREQAGAEIEVGDRVLIYQSKTGRSEGLDVSQISKHYDEKCLGWFFKRKA